MSSCSTDRWPGLFTMAPKGGTLFFLLIVALAALAQPTHGMLGNYAVKNRTKKLMRNCLNKGYPVPQKSDLPVADGNPNPLLPKFVNVLHSVSSDKAIKDPQVDKMTNKTWNYNHLLTMIKLMRNSSGAPACYMRAFVAPLCWATLTKQSESNMTSDNYDTLLKCARPALEDMSLTARKLPANVGKRQNLTNMMKMLYEVMPKDQRTRVVKWWKEQIAQKYYNCTMRPPSDPRSKLMKRCKPLLKWLTSEALATMGPYVSHLAPNDVDSSPKEQLCKFFRSAMFKSSTRMTTRMNPRLAKKFLQRFQECFSGKREFAANVDKLGILACHCSAAPDLTPELGRKLFAELDNCDDCGNSRITQLKKRLFKFVIPHTNDTGALRKLNRSFALLSPEQLSEIPANDLKERVENLGSTVQWTPGQLRILVQKLLGDKCNKVSGEKLIALQSVAGGLPICVLKDVKEIPKDKQGLEKMTERMSKGQLMAMLRGLLDMVRSELVIAQLSDSLRGVLPLSTLDKANIASLDPVENIPWTRPQALLLVKKKMRNRKMSNWRLRSVLQGVTCKMIDEVADSDAQGMAQNITETPQWLSKMQAGCVARKLFATLEKERADYFKTITEEELERIPTLLLLHLLPWKVKDLPDSVCQVFLDKMEEADLSLLPLRSPSRPALTQRALLCLTKGGNLSELTEDVFKLGPLLCELRPSQLRLMAPDVLNSVLEEMASCQHIPRRYRAEIIQLVMQTFGNPSDWSAETMEAMGPLILLDDNVVSALPNKPWMEDSLCSPMLCMNHTSNALRKKCFHSTANTSNATQLTVELIEKVGKDNVYWTVDQLAGMSNKTFLATLETLGAITDYSADQLAVLSKKAVENLGPVSEMNESVVMQMGCITRGFSNADLEKLPFSLESLEKIANCGWNESQMELVWKAVAEYNNLTAQQLGAAEMVALSQFICGLNSSEIEQLNLDAFKNAVGSMNGVQCPSKLKPLAVSAFGNPKNWTEAQVSELGCIIAGLDSTELASLDPSVFSSFNKSCIPHIQNIAALSVDQLLALGPDNAEMVTSEQKADMTDEQQAALETAATGSNDARAASGPDVEIPPDQSGAPSLSVEGVTAFMKPLLFLLMGFLLL
ncbi:otoancorin isoform X2 [Sebastes umbrosus]|uniref:otoancorin isoform X2 n=1 Tax=Sebastes umbrosus TaxID=72105 RepID=UPI00189CEA8B|nr:otoancorin isoform X2 [Sebastes umbrosus]